VLVAQPGEHGRDLVRGGARFLQAQDVWLFLVHEPKAVLPNHRSDAVHVPGYQLYPHGSCGNSLRAKRRELQAAAAAALYSSS
jgi:hypothetical protein